MTRKAVAELEQILDYLAERSPQAAKKVIDQIFAAMERVSRTPSLGHARPDLTDRPVLFHGVYSYLIVYDPNAKPIRVLHVIHGMRDIERILANES